MGPGRIDSGCGGDGRYTRDFGALPSARMCNIWNDWNDILESMLEVWVRLTWTSGFFKRQN